MVDPVISPWLVAVLAPVFLVVAGVYASVGLGGGSGYLAVMALLGLPPEIVPSTALTLNVVVTSAALVRYGLARRLHTGLLGSFLLPALPFAFLGGFVEASHTAFFAVLALGLGAASVAMLSGAARADEGVVSPSRRRLFAVAFPCGSAIGFLSGFLGIGGGVFLGPLLLLLRWASPKQVAAMNAATVLSLSVAGLAAHGVRGTVHLPTVAPLAVAVLAGGFVGAHIGETKLSGKSLQRVLAAVVLLAAVKAAWSSLS